MSDKQYMERALELAQKANPAPNPQVGAVIVKEDKVIGEGFHAQAGSDHAEIVALKNCSDPEGATLYVTLEPCCHHGKTGPCTQALIKAGIREAVIYKQDPNPLVNGKGVKELEQAGIAVRFFST